MPALDGIKHVVVLMLENRSFDCMFGMLYPKSAEFDGLTGKETNPYTKPDGSEELQPVWNNDGMEPATACIPDPDPGELFQADMTMQIFGLKGSPSDDPPKMNGFVDSYVRQKGPPQPDPLSVMHYFTQKQVPVISQLAKAFGVSDQWHASAPCQTWPNRFFAHTGTAGGYVDNEPYRFPYEMETIFERLGASGNSWKVYFHDLPQSATLANIWHEVPFHFCFFEDEFAEDCRNGDLPNYSFIEPRYFTSSDLIPNVAYAVVPGCYLPAFRAPCAPPVATRSDTRGRRSFSDQGSRPWSVAFKSSARPTVDVTWDNGISPFRTTSIRLIMSPMASS
jgi:phospholipase C